MTSKSMLHKAKTWTRLRKFMRCAFWIFWVSLLSLTIGVLITWNAARAEGISSGGHIQLHYFPPHNEFDPNPGVTFAERVVARYALDTNITLRYKQLSAFAEPLVLLGDSRPQLSYNHKANPLALRLEWGLGYRFSKHIEARLTSSKWRDLGGYAGETLQWNSISLRFSW